MTTQLSDKIDAIMAESPAPWTKDGCGVTRGDLQITSLVHHDAYLDDSDRHRVLLISGLSGGHDGYHEDRVLSVLKSYSSSQRVRNKIALSVIACANPGGRRGGDDAGGDPRTGYPPVGGYFDHATDPEARYLWRYIGFMAPDYVVELREREGEHFGWEAAGAPASLMEALRATPTPKDSSLMSALSRGTPNDLGQIPTLRLTHTPVVWESVTTHALWPVLDALDAPTVSPARAALAERRGRSPLDVAAALAPRYGDRLDPVIYTQGVALSGRLRLGELNGNLDEYAQGVAQVVESYLSGGRPWFGESAGGANHAGIVWADEMRRVTGDARYRDLLLETAELYRGNEPGSPPPPCDPDYRTEDFFFCGALMGRAYALTGDESYMDIQTAFLLAAGIQQDDGLFRHCRSVPHYWGRGNGFAALGFAETLTHLPESHGDRDELLDMHVRHLDALRGLQRPSGMLCQLLDLPGSYQELTATCMTGYAVARGLRFGWLDDSYRAFAESLWRAASERIGLDGGIVDGCTGTGAVDDRRFYIDRPAECGQDDRTGNLALWFAVEMERLRRGV